MRKNLLKKSLFVTILIAIIFTTFSPILDVQAVEETPAGEGGSSSYTLKQTNTKSAGDDYLFSARSELDANTKTISSSIDGLGIGVVKMFKNLFMPDATIVYNSETNEPVTTSDGKYLILSQPGAIDSVVAMNSNMYENPPASGIVYAQQELKKITEGHVAKAADPEDSWVYYPGLGFNLLNPIQKYWTVTRNIAYVAMIVIIILVAFLVVFRSNFSGQTQVTIANSIPNIVIALIMITISYPLSGLAIDLITVGSNLAQQILVQNTYSPGYEDIWQKDSINIYDLTLDSDGNLITGIGDVVDAGRLNYPLENP